MKINLKLTSLLFLLALSFNLSAQSLKTERFNGVTKSVQLEQRIPLAQAEGILRNQLDLPEGTEPVLFDQVTDHLDHTHYKYQQYHNGIKVENAIFTIHEKKGMVKVMNGQFFDTKDVVTNPTLSEQQALSNALLYIGAETYMWENMQNELFAQETEAAGTFMPQGELVIVNNRLSTNKEESIKPVLAYKFNIYAETPLSRDYVYVNALSGEVSYVEPIIKNCFHEVGKSCSHDNQDADNMDYNPETLMTMLAAGTAATRYSGSRTIETSTTSGGHRLRETTRGSGIETYDCNTGTSYNNAVDFVDNNNDWTASEWDNSAKDNAALDAHWGAEMTYDYWMNEHNRNSYNGSGAAIKSYIHYDSNYDNAFWNGSVMTYGDGSGTYFDALTSLDVAAHEVGHAICSFTADLAYQRESGAMNEGFSDIWGACIEQMAAPEKDEWLIGEDIERRAGHAALRSMSDPNSEGQPDTYGGTNWINPNCGTPTQSNDYCGVHTNSGVLNYWFYLLTEGGSSTNDIGNSFTVAGIGITDAAKIAYRLESVYLSANSTFADARSFGITAAEDLFSAGSAQVIATTNAFYAVGVGGEYGNTSYCASQGNSVSDEWIGQVQIGSFSNSSGAQSYTDFTSQTVNVDAGTSYATTLTPTYGGQAYSETWRIWVDFNGDGDFEDSNELLYTSANGANAVSGNIAIPAGTEGVTTRMRISMKYNAAPTSCETFSYGEVEDYTIAIGGAAPPVCDVPTGLSTSNITETTASASWTAVTDADDYTIQFRQTGTSSWTNGVIAGTSASLTGLTASTSYEIQVRSNCSFGSSAYSSSSNFTTATPAPVCDAPTGLSTSSVTETTATASWNAATNATGYTIQFRQVGASSWTSSAISTTAANLTGLTASTNYEVQIRTNCASGSSAYSSSATFTTNTPAPTGTCTGGITSFPYTEGFESGLGGWSQGGGDDFDWTRKTGSTGSSNTGPSSATEGSYYMYTESSSPNYSAKVTILNSPCYDLSAETSASFNFEYHLYGASNMGGLVLEASTDNGSSWTSVWSKSGNQGNAWAAAAVDLAAYTGSAVQLRFVGTTGSTWQGDMAVDNISLTGAGSGGGGCVDVNVNITFDNYPEETSWAITDASGATVANGGTYGSQADGSSLTITECLDAGCYDFTISDAYGDGICCSYGNGSYSVTSGGSTLASGSSFTSSATSNVCVGGATFAGISGIEIEANTTVPADAEYGDEFASTAISLFPNPAKETLNVRYESSQAASGQLFVRDIFGKTISVKNVDLSTGTNSFKVSLNSLSNGTYFIEIENGTESLVRRFMVVK